MALEARLNWFCRGEGGGWEVPEVGAEQVLQGWW